MPSHPNHCYADDMHRAPGRRRPLAFIEISRTAATLRDGISIKGTGQTQRARLAKPPAQSKAQMAALPQCVRAAKQHAKPRGTPSSESPLCYATHRPHCLHRALKARPGAGAAAHRRHEPECLTKKKGL